MQPGNFLLSRRWFVQATGVATSNAVTGSMFGFGPWFLEFTPVDSVVTMSHISSLGVHHSSIKIIIDAEGCVEEWVSFPSSFILPCHSQRQLMNRALRKKR
jgi:hypothetical protein